MAEGYVAAGSRAEARERIRLIAEELARRSSTEHLKAEASALRERVTAQVKSKATEKTNALKARAREAARERAYTLKEQVMAKPVALAIAGSVAGALVGAFLGRRSEEAQHYVKAETLSTGTVQPPNRELRADIAESFGEPVEEGGFGAPAGDVGAKERISEAVDHSREKVSEAMGHGRERLSGAVDHARQTASSLKDRAQALRHRAAERISDRVPRMSDVRGKASGFAHNEPELLAFGALAAGACLGLILPLTQTERRALRPVHERAREGLQTGFEKAEEALDGRAEDVSSGDLQHGREANEDLEVERHGAEGFEPPALH